MYITAQRVRSPSLGAREGINAFFNLHDEEGAQAEDWDNPSLDRLADVNPGVLVDQECDLAPGGNQVRSFLDVVTANTTDLSQLGAALEAFEGWLASKPLPCVATLSHVTIRFDADRALEAERVDEYQTLKARVLRLFERHLRGHGREAASSAG
jgi:hypothetical protein